MIAFYDLQAVNAPHRDAVESAIRRVLDTGPFILGPNVEAFEAAFADLCGADHAVGVASGLDALTLILRGYGIGEGDEVIVPANTFIATVLAVSAVGALPVLVDPDPDTMLITPEIADAAVSPRTRAIIAVHLYGRLCDMSGLRSVARDRRVLLVEDAAQAHGATTPDGERAGSLGDAAAFSFYPTKNLGALGDGGAVTTDDPALATRIRRLRNYGSTTKNVHAVVGANSRLDELQAAVLLTKLPALDVENARRRRIALTYAEAVRGTSISLEPPTGAAHVMHLCVVRTSRRAALCAALDAAEIGWAIHYPVPPHRQDAYRGLEHSPLPVTEALARSVLSVPAHPALGEEETARVAEVLHRVG